MRRLSGPRPTRHTALATGVLRHRLLLSPAAEIEGKQVEALVAQLVEQTEAPR